MLIQFLTIFFISFYNFLSPFHFSIYFPTQEAYENANEKSELIADIGEVPFDVINEQFVSRVL